MRALPLALLLLLPVVGAAPDVAAMMDSLLLRAATTGGGSGDAAGASDVGYGVRTEDYPCYVATLVNVFHVSLDGVPRDGITVEPTVIAPEPDVPCGDGFDSWLGEARAIVHEDAYDWTACTAFEGALGGWATISDPCHVADFREATITGRVGTMRAVDCWQDVCVTLQQVFGGTNNAPGFADVVTIRIA